jgi:hypothetical protein
MNKNYQCHNDKKHLMSLNYLQYRGSSWVVQREEGRSFSMSTVTQKEAACAGKTSNMLLLDFKMNDILQHSELQFLH